MTSSPRTPRSGRSPTLRCQPRPIMAKAPRPQASTQTRERRSADPACATSTVGELREALATLADETAVLVGVGDPHHVNVLLGEFAVRRFVVLPNGQGRALVIDVDLVS